MDTVGQIQNSNMWNSSYNKYPKTIPSFGNNIAYKTINDQFNQSLVNNPINVSIDLAKSLNYISNCRPYLMVPMMEPNQSILPATISPDVIAAQTAITQSMCRLLITELKTLPITNNPMSNLNVNPLMSHIQPAQSSQNTLHALPLLPTLPSDPMYGNVLDRYHIRNSHVAMPKKKWIHNYLMSK